MKRYYLLLTISLFFGCNDSKESNNSLNLRSMDVKNPVAYIPPQCYTKTENRYNPCYSCHTKGKEPNFIDDSALQEGYDFLALDGYKNHWSNLFKDRTQEIEQISDEEIIKYISQNNYIIDNEILLATKLNALPKNWDFNENGKWDGYIPDSYFNFDKDGFDKNPNGSYSGWRAFTYYPFLGTFFPTNGSSDDVLIRLPKEFREDSNGNFNLEIYKLNLAIVESLIKAQDIAIDEVDESLYGVDLDRDGNLSKASKIGFAWSPLNGINMSYVGLAKNLLESKKIHLAKGLYPEGSEFLHSVRYIDSNFTLTPRMKELRYAKKLIWKNYTDLEIFSINLNKEISEDSGSPAIKVGNMEDGIQNSIGWIFQGFIEDKDGELRPQTYEESLSCIACHSTIGAITDSTFTFARKYSWGDWSNQPLKNMRDRILNNSKGEYELYLENNHAGDEFRENREIIKKFFDSNGDKNESAFEILKSDISYLLLPSQNRAMELNKAYKIIVKEQSYIYGKDATIKPAQNVYQEIKENQSTGLKIIE